MSGDGMDYFLSCDACGEEYGREYPSQLCSCGGLLEVNQIGRVNFSGASAFWDYEPLLPKGRYRHYEVGSTKTVKSKEGACLKLETGNPTRSFKDRGSVIEIGKAIEYGFTEIACASTGNMAYSLAYYADIEGMKARIFMPRHANRDKLRDIREIGDARVTLVDGDFNTAQAAAARYAKRNRSFLAGDFCYRKEGQKTVAFELLENRVKRSHIIVPVGNATLISGVYKAMRELARLGRLKGRPKIIGVEAAGCNPLSRAMASGRMSHMVPRTKADAIAVGYPTFWKQAIAGLKETGGRMVTASDREMEREQKAFYRTYGLVAELAGVASIVAAKKLGIDMPGTAAVISGGNV